ncbi:regulatory protein [Legionella norrlandica]|uniref:Regulatory protein n=1 Tax=Legionella norrlandica TaxID=1498499 RepID=A0A0A2ST77_9GAMM|nr:TauD/TfdA family dioxygenase [Legionella norrlandica]KGP63942.1 regulatory protein [Legionella norrlandica]
MNLNFNTAPGMNVPMVIASPDNLKVSSTPLLNIISEYHDEIIKMLNKHGAIIFRGFACQDEVYFSKAIELCALGKRCSTSDYDLPRTVLGNEIYTSSDLPAHIPLPLHHEKPRSKNPPNHIYFCCVTPPQEGGGTIFANAEKIWADIPQSIQDKMAQYGVLYKQFFHGQSIRYHLLKKILGNHCARSWSEYFDTEDKIQIEQNLIKKQVKWKWINHSNDLIILNNLPGALKHPLTNKTVWFNSSAYLNYYSNLNYGELKNLRSFKYWASRYLILRDMLPLVCHYGHGQAFSSKEISEINQVIQHHTCVFHWQKGDFMIVDNFTFMHGKQPHIGDRLLYSCMTAY